MQTRPPSQIPPHNPHSETAILDHIPVGFYRVTPAGKFLYANQKLADILKYSDINVLLNTPLNEIYLEYGNGNKWKQLITQNKGFQATIMARCQDNSIVWVENNTRIIYDRDGAVSYYEGSLNDATGRVKAEHALRISKGKYRNLFDYFPLGLYRSNPEGELLIANQALINLLGFPDQESLLAKNAAEIYANPAQRERWIEEIDAEGFTYSDVQYKRYDGSVFWAQDICKAVYDEIGNLLYYEGTVLDITQNKQTEEELIRLSNAAFITSESIVIADLKLKIHDVNPAALKMLGLTQKESVIGRGIYAFISPENQRTALKYVQQVRKGDSARLIRLSLTNQDGIQVPIAGSTTLIKNSEGTPIGYVAVYRDITEELKTEQALRESEELLHALFETTKDYIYIKDTQRKYKRANQAVCRHHKKTATEMVGATDVELFGLETDHLIEPIDRRVLQGETIEVENIRQIDSSQRILHTIKVPLHDSAGNITGLCGIARDVTESIEAREAERTARKIAEEQTAKLELLTSVAASLNQTVTMDHRMTAALEAVTQLIDSDLAWITSNDEDERVHLISEFGFPKELAISKDGFLKWQDCHCIEKSQANEFIEATCLNSVCNGLGKFTNDYNHIASIPLRIGGKSIGLLNLAKRGTKSISEENLHILAAAGELFSSTIERIRLFERVQLLASIDYLTGIYNRRKFFEVGFEKIEAALAQKQPVSFLMMDIDHYKNVNDTYGHAAGDVVLQEVVKACKRALRTNDIMGRYGGDEFFALLCNTDTATATKIAERLRKRVQALTSKYRDHTIKVTISIGISSLNLDKPNLDRLVLRADEALYASKQNGRNQVSVWQG